VVYYILTLPVTLIFIANGFGQLHYAIKLHKKYSKDHNFINSIFVFLLWIVAGTAYPFFYSTSNANIEYFQTISMIFICVITPLIIFLILYYQHVFVAKRSPDIKKTRIAEVLLEKFDQNNSQIKNSKVNALKTDLHRKCLHLFPAGVIFSLWIFAVYIWDGLWNQNEIWGISGEDYGRFLILTAGYSGILIFAALDYIRLSCIFENRNLYHLLPDNVLNILGKSMKRNEFFEFIKPTALILSFVPIFFFRFSVFSAATLIATIGDGAASIFGMRFGKINFPKTSKKTIVGYFAGFLTSFGISLLSLWLFSINLPLIKLVLIGLGGAIVFFFVDFLNLKIDDNILNPLFCATTMGILYCLL